MASKDSEYTQNVESTFRATESITDFQWPFAYLNNAPEFEGDYWSGYYGAAMLFPPYFIDSQKRGEALPYYLTERQLKVIRDRSRRLVAENEFAVSAIENRISYIVGSGFNYRVLPLHDDVPDDLVEITQRVVDIFVEANRIWEHEQEMVRRVDRDGEAFVRLFFHETGLLQLRWVEPEHVRSPDGDGEPARSFGIETNPTDVEDIRGYWVIEDPLHATNPKFIKGREIVHVKMNLDSAAKRGLPLLYPVEANLRRAEELLAAMTMTTKARAKIALIRRVDGTSKSKAQQLVDAGQTDQIFDPTTGGPTNIEQLKMGTVLTASKNIEYEWPEVGNNQSGVEVLKAELRAVAARLVMPEPMLTADASAGTGQAFLVNEAPATRNFQRLQRFYRGVFGESRAAMHESLIWRQIAHAVRVGLIDREALTHLRVVAKAPAIIPRDPDKSAAAYKTYMDMGVVSPQGVSDELGFNWEQTKRERDEAGLPDLAQMSAALTGGGMPGEQGTTVPGAGMPGGTPGEEGEEDQGPGESDGQGGFDFDGSVFE